MSRTGDNNGSAAAAAAAFNNNAAAAAAAITSAGSGGDGVAGTPSTASSLMTPSQVIRNTNTSSRGRSSSHNNVGSNKGNQNGAAPPAATATASAAATAAPPRVLGPSWLNKEKKQDGSGVPNDTNGGDGETTNGGKGNKGKQTTKKNNKKNSGSRVGGGGCSNNNNNNNHNHNQNPSRRGRQHQQGIAECVDNHRSPNNNDNGSSSNNNNNNNNSIRPKPNKNRIRIKKQKTKKDYPWRKFLDNVEQKEDPITLDPLDELEYPPFALCKSAPFVPVPEWPVPEEPVKKTDDDRTNANEKKKPNLEELNRQRLAEQWGVALLPDEKLTQAKTTTDSEQPTIPLSQRKFWLFDGRALGLYMVSQLQFIDPLSRRDLTRPELVALDQYLKRHGFGHDLKVTAAYDAKGISLSTAGAAAHTAQGRAQIMQETAQSLYNAMFAGTGPGRAVVSRHQHNRPAGSAATSSNINPLQEQYAALQLQEQQAYDRRRLQQQEVREQELLFQQYQQQLTGFGEAGIYGSTEEGGFMIIDDDQNPGLRGRGGGDAFPALSSSSRTGAGGQEGPQMGVSNNGPLVPQFNGARVTGSSTVSAFPALPSAPRSTAPPRSGGGADVSGGHAAVTTINQSSGKKPPPKSSKTLSKISGLVKKTSEQERQRQYMAREEARKKAMLSNLSFGMNPSLTGPSYSLPVAPPSAAAPTATEKQLERNRAFADALGIQPATQRHYNSGWACPTDGTSVLDEFGQELGAALYSETLIGQAKERMQLLMKLEKRWKTFLADDRAASLPLNPMDRASRVMVHEYAKFWKIKTESFDPVPKRYIHCVKLLDTRMPHPLLSTVAREWRGPLPDPSRLVRMSSTDHAATQTAGQSSKSLELPPPLLATAVGPSSSATGRFGGLLDAPQERTKLELAPRSVPAELLPFEPQPQQQDDYDITEDLKRRQAKMEERRLKELDVKQKQQQALEEAFASDDENSGGDIITGRHISGDDDDWGGVPTPLYTGDDEEDE